MSDINNHEAANHDDSHQHHKHKATNSTSISAPSYNNARPKNQAYYNVVFVTGWRLALLTLSISIVMFMVNVEVSVVTTALVSIGNSLGGLNQIGWIVTGYLITYTSLLIIWSKFSDVFGRKPCMLVSVVIFTTFSGGCAAAQTMTQLIVCRVFQGIGAAGCIALGLAIAYEMVPLSEYPKYGAILSGVSAIGSLAGPLLGGGLSERSTWRWAFLVMVPIGAITFILLSMGIPDHFPNHGKPNFVPTSLAERFSARSLSRLDLLGALFLLAASLLLVTFLLEGGVSFEWKSATAIVLVVLSAACWGLFGFNEWAVSSPRRSQEPTFPWRFLSNRPWMGVLLSSLLSGAPYIVCMVDIPQRFQTIGNISPFQAGVRLIPFNFMIALGSVMVNIIGGRGVPSLYLLLFGSILQIVGVTLMSISSETSINAAFYGYQVVAGTGVGFIFGMCMTVPPFIVDSEDVASSAGAVLQFRIFGGAVGLAIAQSVLNNFVTPRLAPLVEPSVLETLLHSTEIIKKLPADIQPRIIQIYGQGYNLRLKTLIAFAGAQVLTSLMLWRRRPISIKRIPVGSDSAEQAGSVTEMQLVERRE